VISNHCSRRHMRRGAGRFSSRLTAIRSHMLTEEPRIIFMHFWANDDAIKLAKGAARRAE
jgi:hypothetical protein